MSTTKYGGSRASAPLLSPENTPEVLIDFTRMDAVESRPAPTPEPSPEPEPEAEPSPEPSPEPKVLFVYDPFWDNSVGGSLR